jgi:hypothetical protein
MAASLNKQPKKEKLHNVGIGEPVLLDISDGLLKNHLTQRCLLFEVWVGLVGAQTPPFK